MKQMRMCLLTCLFVVTVFLSGVATSQAQRPVKVFQILILLSYHETHSWTTDVLAGIKDKLASADINFQLHVEFMDTKRHSPDSIFPQLQAFYLSKYKATTFDLIMLSDNNALNFLLPRRALLFPGVPIVFCGINNFSPALLKGFQNITGVAEASDFAGTIDLALTLQPDTRHIAVVCDNSPTGLAQQRDIQKIYSDFTDRVDFIELFNQTEDELKLSLASLPKHSIVFMLSFYTDRNGKQLTISEQTKVITKSSRVAVYTAWDISLGLGVVGGVMTNGQSQGKNAAQFAIRILHGESVQNIPVMTRSPNVPTLDYTIAKHFHLPIAQLTGETVFINKPTSFYSRYTRVIWTTVLVLFFQFLAISFLIISIRQRKYAEQCLKEQSNRLQEIVDERTSELSLKNRALTQEIAVRKKNEAAIRKSDKQWDKTFESFPDIVTLQDIDLSIVKANQVAATTLGLSHEKIIGQKCYSFFEGSTTPCEGCPVVKAKEDFTSYSREIYHEKLKKTFLVSAAPVMDEQNNVEYIVHVAKDISEEKDAEIVRVLLATAIEQAAETVLITDTRGDIQYVNPAVEKLTGYSRKEVFGQNPRIFQSGKHDKEFYGKMWATLLRGETWHGKLTNRRKDGSLFEEEATFSPVKNSTGKIINFVAVKRDVSKEVALEHQLRQSIKMEAIGTLASGIAHDFNNILSVIIGCGEFIRDEVEKESLIGENIATLLAAGERATDLVRQILTFSRHDVSKKSIFSPYPLVCEALKMLRATIPATVTIKEDLSPDCGMVSADPTIIQQIFVNLCTNSLQSLPGQKGTLHTKLQCQTICKGPGKVQEYFVVMTVKDNGSGMEQQTIDRIFEPYFTTKEAGKGTGLGLAIVHGAVKEYNGFIKVESAPGKGSAFSVFLPLAERAPSQGVVKKQKSGRKIKVDNAKILIVDDELLLVKINTRRLENKGYQVIAFTDPTEALKFFQNQPDAFDLLITDQTMPKLTGAELAEAVLRIKPTLPIIMCTGHSDTVSEEYSLALGIRKYVFKPLHEDELVEAVQELLNGK